ncbi:MAG: hypothetical protein ABIO02_00815 [Patescibacteria group bacterium]
MLTIICGEDTIASRTYFINLQSEYQKKGFYIEKILPNQIEEVIKMNGNEGMLFNGEKLYSVQGLTTYTARKKSKEFEGVIKKLIEDKEITVLDWEEKSAREIKLKATDVKEFKPSQTVFQLQESLYPKNLKQFLITLNMLAETQEEGFIFTMLARHSRTLLLTKTNQLPSTVPPWMKQKLKAQADRWTVEGLSGFYEGIAKLDTSIKTSTNLYGIKGSLELLGCYFLA